VYFSVELLLDPHKINEWGVNEQPNTNHPPAGCTAADLSFDGIPKQNNNASKFSEWLRHMASFVLDIGTQNPLLGTGSRDFDASAEI